ncbi:MAG: D-glycero-beta-D-manno-heptose-7-phosphate kinase [Gemmatimonadetes bacterium]|nr:D-glycero-beta-D-manno-heptose-7-phosphate kinase [Gemmatimonadota bacterium]
MHRLEMARARGLLEGVRAARVLVVGDVMLDVYLRGGAHRISPEAPVPVVRVKDEWIALGGAANVAANLVALGARACLVGMVGGDAAGADLRRVAEGLGMDASGLVVDEGRPTTMKTRVLVGHQQVARYDREVDDELSSDQVSELCRRVERLAADADALALEDYDKGVLVPAVIEAALDAARRRDLPVVVDPKARHFFDYRGSTVFKPNHPELSAALRAPVLAEDPEWLERTRRHLQCENLLVTLGADGMALAMESGRHLRVPAVARSVYDVSGAGDTVTAVMAATLASGGGVEEGAILATHAAGVEVGKAGVVTVAPEEILESLERLVESREA